MEDVKISKAHNPDSWQEQMGRFDNIYARSGYPGLKAREESLAEMIEVPDLALFNSGMAAINVALEAQRLQPGSVVLCGESLYKTTRDVITSLKARGVKVVFVDSSNLQEIQDNMRKYSPNLVFVESVGNTRDMPVCDVKGLQTMVQDQSRYYQDERSLEKVTERYISTHSSPELYPENFYEEISELMREFRVGNNPMVFRSIVNKIAKHRNRMDDRKNIIAELARLVKHALATSREKCSLIIDNTLPSPTMLKIFDNTNCADTLVVESGTKHFQGGADKITLGMVYGSVDNIQQIRQIRSQLGSFLQPSALEELPDNLTQTMPDIMRAHAKNALSLAHELEHISGITVFHPNVSKHPQKGLADDFAPNGLVTVFYVEVRDSQLVLEKIHTLAKNQEVKIGASFGHPETWIASFSPTVVRVAAGFEQGEEYEKMKNILLAGFASDK